MLLAESLLGSSSTAANYIEDVFSTYLYTGTGASQTITNGIDLSTKGGMVWFKSRSAATSNVVADTSRGVSSYLITNDTVAAQPYSILTSFNTNGFTIPASPTAPVNTSPNTYTSWTFRKQAKFFDVVTYTGNGVAGRTVSHNLGSVPGCIIVKRTSADAAWAVYHKGTGPNFSTKLNGTDAPVENSQYWNNTSPTATQFTVGIGAETNANSSTYVAYLFADNAGGFGVSGADNVITCDSFTTDGGAGTATVTLGYEPQFILLRSTVVSDWMLYDGMRGWFNPSGSNRLLANSSGAEGAISRGYPTSSGFYVNNLNLGEKYIYIAIRRGPMKTPTTGTSVYENVAYSGNATTQRQIGSSVLMDMTLISNRTAGATGWTSYAHYTFDRLRGDDMSLATTRTVAESSSWSDFFDSDKNAGWDTGINNQAYLNGSGQTYVSHILKRAPGFFDVVCYTGNSTAGRQVTHNLTVAPEFLIVKRRSGADSWYCYAQPLGNTFDILLNSTRAATSADDIWFSTSPTSTNFTVRQYDAVNGSGQTYVAYLFATVAGVSKVGSYTGTGTTKQIDCGFTGGARFVLIKRTDSTGDWYVWDSARGIVAGNDPYLLLNSTAAEVTNTDYIDTYSAGFEISSTAPAAINANGGSFIFLAIA